MSFAKKGYCREFLNLGESMFRLQLLHLVAIYLSLPFIKHWYSVAQFILVAKGSTEA